MIMGQGLNKIERVYDTVAKEYSETFSGEHEKKPKDQEILYNQRFDPLFTLDPFTLYVFNARIVTISFYWHFHVSVGVSVCLAIKKGWWKGLLGESPVSALFVRISPPLQSPI